MTVKEFFSKENMTKSNPFEGLEIKQRITMDEYKKINDLTASFVFNEKNEYMPLTKDFAFKFWTMVVYLGLDESELPEVEEVFTYINCTDVYDKFIAALEYPNQINNLKSAVDDYTNYCVSNNLLFQEIFARAKDLITTLGNEETIGKFIEMVGTEILARDVSLGDGDNGKVEQN